jgi:hypothetical protein
VDRLPLEPGVEMEKLIHQPHQLKAQPPAGGAVFHLRQLAAALLELVVTAAGRLFPARRLTKMESGASHPPHRNRSLKCPLSTSRRACPKRASSDGLQDSSPIGTPGLQKLLEAFAARGVF